MAKSLVIVESPAKARTIAGFLGPGYVVESSIGHIRDLPRGAADVPARYKKAPWARLGVDVEHGFKPIYVVDADKKEQIRKLQAHLASADSLLLATDEDREGESIAWHLLEVLEPKVPIHRMVFHEITKKAIQEAISHPRELDRRLVDAQEARRILDRLYGYEVSPVLWKKIMPRLSAGRVQSVATRVVVEREAARMRFRVASYWDIEGSFVSEGASPGELTATLVALDGARIASGKDFDEAGQLARATSGSGQSGAGQSGAGQSGAGQSGAGQSPPGSTGSARAGSARAGSAPTGSAPTGSAQGSGGQGSSGERANGQRPNGQRPNGQHPSGQGLLVLRETDARALAGELAASRDVRVTTVERKPTRRSPAPPFMTSTLQQEAGRKLRLSASRTMRAAQSLYENGFITYMRTDSTTLSDSALRSAREQIQHMYGAEYLPARPRLYKNKVKNAQEAHEAIRPAGEVFKHPDEVKRQVGGDEARLYELIWMRTVACQMEDARLETLRVRVTVRTPAGREAEFSATGNTILFPGFLRAYVEGSDDPALELESRERPLPALLEGQALRAKSFEPHGHETQPPARFTEASLVKRLEELGVGRPSTYASILGTIQQRGYVWKKGTALVPSFTAFAVVTLMEQHFGELVDYAFTARMEDELDAIARGDERAEPWLSRFYFGDAGSPGSPAKSGGSDGEAAAGSAASPAPQTSVALGLHQLVEKKLGEIDARAINSMPLGKDSQGRDVVVRVGRYGAFLQRGEETTSLPEELPPDELTVAKAEELLAKPRGDRSLGVDPATGLEVAVRAGRFGAYVQLGVGGGKGDKPRTSSLLRSMNPETATLDDALRLLSLPRQVGVDPSDGKPIQAQLGRYGPYISKGSDTRSLAAEEDVFGVTLEQALALFAQPRQRGRAAQAEPLKELGPDGASGKVITLRKGRFGFYVTDGETNASLRSDDSTETLTPERAQELLQLRRDRGPSKKKVTRRSAKKAPSRRAAARPTTGARVVAGSVRRKKAAPGPSAAPGVVAAKKKPTSKPKTSKKARAPQRVAAPKGPKASATPKPNAAPTEAKPKVSKPSNGAKKPSPKRRASPPSVTDGATGG